MISVGADTEGFDVPIIQVSKFRDQVHNKPLRGTSRRCFTPPEAKLHFARTSLILPNPVHHGDCNLVLGNRLFEGTTKLA